MDLAGRFTYIHPANGFKLETDIEFPVAITLAILTLIHFLPPHTL
jgi:hypothetical protein